MASSTGTNQAGNRKPTLEERLAPFAGTVIGGALMLGIKASELFAHTLAGFLPGFGKTMDRIKADDEQLPDEEKAFSWYNPAKAYRLGGMARLGTAAYVAVKAPAIATGITGLLGKYFGLGIAATPLILLIKIPLLVYVGYKAVDLIFPGFWGGVKDYFKELGDMYKTIKARYQPAPQTP